METAGFTWAKDLQWTVEGENQTKGGTMGTPRADEFHESRLCIMAKICCETSCVLANLEPFFTSSHSFK